MVDEESGSVTNSEDAERLDHGFYRKGFELPDRV
jgi:hypothetical protein